MRDEINLLKEKLIEKNEIISKLKNFRKLENKNYIPIIEVEGSIESIKENSKNFSLRNRVILLRNIDQIEVLNDYNIDAAIVERINEKVLEGVNFPVLLKDGISIEKINNILAIEKKEFENKINKARKVGFVKWLKKYKKRKL